MVHVHLSASKNADELEVMSEICPVRIGSASPASEGLVTQHRTSVSLVPVH